MYRPNGSRALLSAVVTRPLARKPVYYLVCSRFSTGKSKGTGTDQVLDIRDRRHGFYNATFGRWLFNDEKRLAERHLYFDLDKFRSLVAEAVGQSSEDILHLKKIAEGGSRRVFEVLFKDQRNVIVRLPYPCTVPRKYGVASEVATIEYLRFHGLPIPKVLSWSSTRSNSLGWEYIIMEKARGKGLEEIWYTMGPEKRERIMNGIVYLENLLFKIKFPANGSLYFKNSLPADIRTVDIPDNDNFCLGPSTEYLWWYHKRDGLLTDRGPWKSTLELLKAVGQRELEWLEAFGEPRYPREPLYRELYGDKKVHPGEQIANLQNYLGIAPYLVPAVEILNKSTIRHTNLSPTNIFVDESGDITSIIDWERTAVLPMFLHARVPADFQNFGDEVSESLELPSLPENFESLSKAEKERETELYRRRQIHYYYLHFMGQANEPHFRALGTPGIIARNQIYDAACEPWEGNNTSLKAQLINLSHNWASLKTEIEKPQFPIAFSEAEMKSCLDIEAEQKTADAQMQTLRDHFGCSADGWVPAWMYEEAKQKVDDLKVHMLQIAETEQDRRDVDERYPFQDHEEIL